MFPGKLLKLVCVITLFFFTFFVVVPEFSVAKNEEDELMKAGKLYQEGDYEGAIKILGDFVAKLKAMVEQKKNVAEAFYLLAKIYYEVGDDAKVDENLRKVYETFPTFAKEESNFDFKDRAQAIRTEVLAAKGTKATEVKVIEQPSPKGKKKKFPILLVGGAVVVAIVAAALLSKNGDEEKEVFDIRGNWTINEHYHDSSSATYYFTFTGSLVSGTFIDNDGGTGWYTATGRAVTFAYDTIVWRYRGDFSNKDQMNGNIHYTIDGTNYTGTWNANRGGPGGAKNINTFKSGKKALASFTTR